MDIDMPLKDGHETTIDILDFFKAHKTSPSVISACSAFVQENEKKKAFLSGMTHYVTKPIDTLYIESILSLVFINDY